MALLDNTYWNAKGLYQEQANKLGELIPLQGECEHYRTTNKALDKFRRAQNCYYDLYNNGLCNRADEFRRVFGFGGTVIVKEEGYVGTRTQWTESEMDNIIYNACQEQGIPCEVRPHYYLSR